MTSRAFAIFALIIAPLAAAEPEDRRALLPRLAPSPALSRAALSNKTAARARNLCDSGEWTCGSGRCAGCCSNRCSSCTCNTCTSCSASSASSSSGGINVDAIVGVVLAIVVLVGCRCYCYMRARARRRVAQAELSAAEVRIATAEVELATLMAARESAAVQMAKAQAELAALMAAQGPATASIHSSLTFLACAPGSLGLTLASLADGGVVVEAVSGGSELAREGLRAGDRIEEIGGEYLLNESFDSVVAVIQDRAKVRPLIIKVVRHMTAAQPVATYARAVPFRQ